MIHRSSRLLLDEKGSTFHVTCKRTEAYAILIESPFSSELVDQLVGIRDSLDARSVHVVTDALAVDTAERVAAAAQAAGLGPVTKVIGGAWACRGG